MTAKEFLEKNCGTFKDSITKEVYADYVSPKLLIEFAKYHVENALKAADNNARVTVVDYEDELHPPKPIWGVDSESILDAYPLTYII